MYIFFYNTKMREETQKKSQPDTNDIINCQNIILIYKN